LNEVSEQPVVPIFKLKQATKRKLLDPWRWERQPVTKYQPKNSTYAA